MNGKINLYENMFSEKEKTLFENKEFSATIFRYSSGIEAVTLKNACGYITVLPFMGQMIWDMEFLGHNMVMKSMFPEPEVCMHHYGESYGCFLMHCGLLAMGNPSKEDNHMPHGEIPIAKYKEAYIILGEDDRGKYISLSGIYSHKMAFEIHYEFSPEIRLYETASAIELFVNISNKKDLPLEYFYLCHINYLPVDGAKLFYTANPKNITAHDEVPSGYPREKETKAYLKKLNKDMSIMDNIDSETQSYAPEIVFTCKYDADEKGNAHTLQLLPDGYSCYVSHRPEELPFGVRWFSRTEDEDALGMVLPATAQHFGYQYCKKHGQEKYLGSRQSITYHITAGILSPEESDTIIEKIKKVNGGN